MEFEMGMNRNTRKCRYRHRILSKRVLLEAIAEKEDIGGEEDDNRCRCKKDCEQ